jgi:hypothetical protein
MIAALRTALKPVLRPAFARLQKQLQDPQRAQQALLANLINGLAQTEYGRAFQINANDDYAMFRAKAPLVGYDDLRDWIERQQREEGRVMVAEPVLFYEKTSGSSGPAKYIPYTRALRRSFNRMFAAWLYDLLARGPRLVTGKTFISISPAFRDEHETPRGVRIGLDTDTEYLNAGMQRLLKRFSVVPASIKQLNDPADFKRVLAAMLLAESNLEVVSIWNPSLLEVILDSIEANRETLIDDLQRGLVTCGKLEFRFARASRDRLDHLQQSSIDWPRVWPRLKLISCWTSAHASQSALRITKRFPGVYLQGKGLLATEAPMTIPLIEANGFVPLPGEVFYEFIDERGNLSRLHELESGREYEIVITQQGGLARYRIGDLVRVTRDYQSTPCLEFIGRSDAVCDLVGEKLNESFVQECLSKLLQPSRFQTLLPVMTERGRSQYVLVVDELSIDANSLATQLDAALCAAFHYRNARLLGQLDAVRVRVTANARDMYFDYFTGKGMKWGDIKHQYLIKNLADATKLMAILDPSTAHLGALES